MTVETEFWGARDVIPWRPKAFRTQACHVSVHRTPPRATTRLFAKDFRELREDFPRSPEFAVHV
jgi:hypothetical protein